MTSELRHEDWAEGILWKKEDISPDKEQYYLMKFECDYSDEFDVYGISIINLKEMNEIYEGIEKAKYPKECYFGSNEMLMFENGIDAKRSFTFEALTDNEYQVLKKMFPKEFGFIPDFAEWKH